MATFEDEGLQLKHKAMENAARRRKECLAACREHLIDLAILRDDGCVTADDAFEQIERMGLASGLRLPTAGRRSLCYKFRMPKIVERWLLFQYVGGEFTPMSKPLRTKEHAEKARLKYPERERKTIGIGVIRTKG